MDTDMNYQRIAVHFQQRISELVTRYEGDLALSREDCLSQIDAATAKIAELEAKIAELESAGTKSSAKSAE